MFFVVVRSVSLECLVFCKRAFQFQGHLFLTIEKAWIKSKKGNATPAAIVGKSLIAPHHGRELEMEVKWFPFKIKVKRKMSLSKKKKERREQHWDTRPYKTLCEVSLYIIPQKIYCIVLNGFLNGIVQSGHVILRMKKNKNVCNIGSILC